MNLNMYDICAVRDFIASGADVNKKDKYGETPLLLAATQENIDIVRLLIEKGAYVNAKKLGGFYGFVVCGVFWKIRDRSFDQKRCRR